MHISSLSEYFPRKTPSEIKFKFISLLYIKFISTLYKLKFILSNREIF